MSIFCFSGPGGYVVFRTGYAKDRLWAPKERDIVER